MTYIIIYGDLADGITKVVGGFATPELASAYAEANNHDDEMWIVVEVTQP